MGPAASAAIVLKGSTPCVGVHHAQSLQRETPSIIFVQRVPHGFDPLKVRAEDASISATNDVRCATLRRSRRSWHTPGHATFPLTCPSQNLR